MPLAITREGRLTPRAAEILRRADQPDLIIAEELGIKASSVRIYLSRLRTAGYPVPTRQTTPGRGLLVTLSLPADVTDVLTAQARRRGLKDGARGMAEAIVARVCADKLFQAVFDDPPERARP